MVVVPMFMTMTAQAPKPIPPAPGPGLPPTGHEGYPYNGTPPTGHELAQQENSYATPQQAGLYAKFTGFYPDYSP